MKKLMLWVVIMLLSITIIMTFSVVGCKKESTTTLQETQESTTPVQENDFSNLKIAYMQTGPYPYYEKSALGVRYAGEKFGFNVYVYNTDLKAEKEIANVEDAILQGVDGIILFSISSTAATQSVALANKAGIPIMLLYGYSEELKDKADGFMQANCIDVGKMVGQWVAKNIESGQVAQIQGQLGRGDVEQYTQGFEEGVAENPNLTMAIEQPADYDPGKAYTIMENIITSYPDLKAVYCHNEDTALSAYKALKVHGKDKQVSIVSHNGSPEGISAIKLGLLAATSAFSPSKESQILLTRLIKVIKGETLKEKLMYTPIKLIDINNTDEVDAWDPTLESTQAIFDEYYFSK